MTRIRILVPGLLLANAGVGPRHLAEFIVFISAIAVFFVFTPRFRGKNAPLTAKKLWVAVERCSAFQ